MSELEALVGELRNPKADRVRRTTEMEEKA